MAIASVILFAAPTSATTASHRTERRSGVSLDLLPCVESEAEAYWRRQLCQS